MKKDFITLIHKDLTGELTAQEASLLKKWKAQSEENREIYRDTKRTWELSVEYVPKIKVDAKAAFAAQMAKIKAESEATVIDLNASKKVVEDINKPTATESSTKASKETKVLPFRKLASIAAIFVGVAATLLLFRPSSGLSYEATSGIQFVSLEDGSSIWLDQGSKITLDKDFGDKERNLTLTGKAHFDIARDESRPFNIQADDIEVSVLGTAFTIDANDENATVAVTHGKVKVETEAQEEVVLTRGMKAIESSEGIESIEVDPNSIDKWTNDQLAFDNAPLTQVFADLENFFHVEINYKGRADLSRCPFTSKSLAKNTLDEILDILELTYNMRVKKKSETKIELSRIRCRS